MLCFGNACRAEGLPRGTSGKVSGFINLKVERD